VDDRRQRRHDQAVAAALDQVWQRRANRAPHTEQVDLDDAFERLRVHRPHEPGGRDARVRHHDVDAAEVRGDLVRDAFERVPVGDIGFPRPAAGLRGDLFELGFLEPDEREPSPARGQLPRHLGADAPGRAGDQYHLARDVHAATVTQPTLGKLLAS
jgi:hypothetical protein